MVKARIPGSVIAAIIAALLLPGCAASPDEGTDTAVLRARPGDPLPADRLARHSLVAWAKIFDSVGDLAEVADLVALGHPTGETDTITIPQDDGGPDVVVMTYEFDVAETLAGRDSAEDGRIWVTEFNVTDRDGLSLLVEDTWFVLFLTRYIAPINGKDAADTGAYVVVGGPGAAFVSLDRRADMFVPTDPEQRVFESGADLEHIRDALDA